MNINIKSIIEDYKKYLKKKDMHPESIVESTKNISYVKLYERIAKTKLKELDYLSLDYKLYDSDYNDFMIAMGKFALALEKIKEFEVENNSKERYMKSFIKIHERFEELNQKNIMKDVYIWKYLNK